MATIGLLHTHCGIYLPSGIVASLPSPDCRLHCGCCITSHFLTHHHTAATLHGLQSHRSGLLFRIPNEARAQLPSRPPPHMPLHNTSRILKRQLLCTGGLPTLNPLDLRGKHCIV